MEQTKWFESEAFADAFHTQVPLGAFCGREGTLFRLWAPTAQSVTLRLYVAGDGGESVETLSMCSGQKGTWEYRTDRNLDGMYYDYLVTAEDVCRRTQDPYAKACGVNGVRGMILDLSKTDPPGWSGDKAPAQTAEQVIYELHIRDFSWDKAGGFAPEDRGRFSAFLRSGTTLNGDGVHPTGVDYLKRLGVTHIQLMPMYDYGSVDETCPESGYNWGYDPVNYNIPEGSYSSDPYQGEVRIRQLKQAIAALHAQGFRVIMDVVYNHTYELESCLFKTAPWYYYRRNADGRPSNGSGCGNDIATERSMCARYILESVLYWTRQYHVDGFRFDLMGLMDVPLMNRIQAELDRIYGPGEKLLYGEPWRAGDTAARPGTVLCTKDNLKALDPKLGAFCDDTRDAVKGSVMDAGSTGFVNGGTITAQQLVRCVRGWTGELGPNQSPGQTVTYLSCHDDWTLWDKLVYTMDPKQDFFTLQEPILQANRLAAAICFCCQGHIFIHAGEEFGRTKGGIKNSFRSSADINCLDWRRAWDNSALVDYYRGLIALRKSLPGLWDKSQQAARRILWARDEGVNCVSLCLDNGEECPWHQVLMVFNCADECHSVSLPQGKWQLLVDGTSSFRWQETVFAGEVCNALPKSALILGKTE